MWGIFSSPLWLWKGEHLDDCESGLHMWKEVNGMCVQEAFFGYTNLELYLIFSDLHLRWQFCQLWKSDQHPAPGERNLGQEHHEYLSFCKFNKRNKLLI